MELNFSRVYSRRSINFVTLRLIIFNLLYFRLQTVHWIYSGVETSGLLPVTQSKAGAVQKTKTKTNKNAKLGFYHIWKGDVTWLHSQC